MIEYSCDKCKRVLSPMNRRHLHGRIHHGSSVQIWEIDLCPECFEFVDAVARGKVMPSIPPAERDGPLIQAVDAGKLTQLNAVEWAIDSYISGLRRTVRSLASHHEPISSKNREYLVLPIVDAIGRSEHVSGPAGILLIEALNDITDGSC